MTEVQVLTTRQRLLPLAKIEAFLWSHSGVPRAHKPGDQIASHVLKLGPEPGLHW